MKCFWSVGWKTNFIFSLHFSARGSFSCQCLLLWKQKIKIISSARIRAVNHYLWLQGEKEEGGGGGVEGGGWGFYSEVDNSWRQEPGTCLIGKQTKQDLFLSGRRHACLFHQVPQVIQDFSLRQQCSDDRVNGFAGLHWMCLCLIWKNPEPRLPHYDWNERCS